MKRPLTYLQRQQQNLGTQGFCVWCDIAALLGSVALLVLLGKMMT